MPDNAEYMEKLLNQTEPNPLVAGLREIQELHKPVDIEEWFHTMDGSDSRIVYVCSTCEDHERGEKAEYPCPTRRAADKALGEADG